MRYLTFNTQQEALDISSAAMRASGGNTATQYRYQVRECSLGMFHLCCTDNALEVQGQATHANEPIWPPEQTI